MNSDERVTCYEAVTCWLKIAVWVNGSDCYDLLVNCKEIVKRKCDLILTWLHSVVVSELRGPTSWHFLSEWMAAWCGPRGSPSHGPALDLHVHSRKSHSRDPIRSYSFGSWGGASLRRTPHDPLQGSAHFWIRRKGQCHSQSWQNISAGVSSPGWSVNRVWCGAGARKMEVEPYHASCRPLCGTKSRTTSQNVQQGFFTLL